MSTVDDLLFTLQICRKCLPGDAHPVHFERLAEIERIVKAAKASEAAKTPRREGGQKTGQSQ